MTQLIELAQRDVSEGNKGWKISGDCLLAARLEVAADGRRGRRKVTNQPNDVLIENLERS